MLVSHPQRSFPRRMDHRLGKMDTDLILPSVRGTQTHSHPLAQVGDVAELVIPGNHQEQSQWISTRQHQRTPQGLKRTVAHQASTRTAMIQRATYHEDQKR